ncbi:formin-binding protein [Vanrija albida]|uniref:Formin-binding protein n=1 Tax=Vanrija albida TaxID=181172 RepID=A0ABR3PV26_9TREE
MADDAGAAPARSQSTTSLARLHHGSLANGAAPPGADESDPALDFCNAFWGPGDRGYEVIMARLRGASRTIDELKQFWKERAAIEEEYGKRLQKLAKLPLGKDEIGDLAASLQSIQEETAAQASYHLNLSTDLHQLVEVPTTELGNRYAHVKKGMQATVEKAWRNKGLQEGHVAKTRERYESDCLKLNSYTANTQLVQGKELEKIHGKADRVRQTIGSNEQDFRNFVSVLEGTTQKWENEWKTFTDHVQDLEEDRLVQTKDIAWAYANQVSQVCVEDDSSCERIRERLEQFEPASDMFHFVRGWGTGDQIPDPPKFVNYSLGENPPRTQTFHTAAFRRVASKLPLRPVSNIAGADPEPEQAVTEQQRTASPEAYKAPAPPPVPKEEPFSPPQEEPFTPPSDGVNRLTLRDDGPTPPAVPPAASRSPKPPVGGVALPGLAAGVAGAAAGTAAIGAAAAYGGYKNSHPPPVATASPPTSNVEMPPPPVPQAHQGPPSPSARDVLDEDDPMARALAELRRDPPGSNVRRQRSQKRPGSVYSTTGSIRSNNQAASSVAGAPSAAPSSYYQGHQRTSVDSGLIPPAGGHTAAQLAKSKADFDSGRGRQSVNYSSYGDDIVGGHPSRPSSPAARSPSPSAAMMQPPTQPATHPADAVLQQYHQAFPGERSRSRPASVYSNNSRAPSINESAVQSSVVATDKPREGFVGIGAGGRSPSPAPNKQFRSPSPGPGGHGVLGPQNLGISLDASGGVAQDSMAEAYRRQYEQQRQQSQPPGGHERQQSLQQPPVDQQRPVSQHSYQQPPAQHQQQQQPAASGYVPPAPAPFSQYAPAPSQSNYYPTASNQYNPAQRQQSQPPPQQQQQQQQSPYAPPQQQGYQAAQQPPQQQQQQQQQYDQYGRPLQGQPPSGYAQHTHQSSQSYSRYSQPPQQQQQGYHDYQQNSYSKQPEPQQYRAPSPQPAAQQYRAPSPQPAAQQYRAPSPQPAAQHYRTPSPQPQQPAIHHQASQDSYHTQNQSQYNRSPSPQPNLPPNNAPATGQWSSTGLPILFYVQARYDYHAQSAAEFDFQSGDIIAVTSTPEDGWWSGELLDEARRTAGRTDFPSNFVELF